MVFELHIWGPAFGLPSIDPECLAAVAFLRLSLQPNEWALIPSNDPSVSPFGELPALYDGGEWVSGYRRIVGHLRNLPDRKSLDGQLSQEEQADCAAYTAFIESRGAPLLDLSLFVSSENYTNVTRSLIGDMLTWPNSWTIPGRLRDTAKKRSEHLGLSGLDIDAAAEEAEAKQREQGGLSGQIPDTLKKGRTTLSGILGKGVRGNQFRLTGVTDDFLEPVEDLLADHQWLLRTANATSLDCLAIGYLALMMSADVPHAWLKLALEDRYHKLGRWTKVGVKELFGGGVEVKRTGKGVTKTTTVQGSTLPWRTTLPRTWTMVGAATIQSLTESLPIIGPAYLHPQVRSPSNDNKGVAKPDKQMALARLKNRQLFYGQIVVSCLGMATTMGLLFWLGALRLPKRPPKTARRDFGAAGAMLGLR